MKADWEFGLQYSGMEPSPEAVRREVDALNEQAWAARNADARRSLDMSTKAYRLAETSGYRRGEAYALRNRGVCQWLLAQYNAALADLLSSLPIFQREGDAAGEASALNWVGNTFWRLTNYQGALSYHQQSLEIRRRIGDRPGEAASLNNIGLNYFDLGRFGDALERHFESLAISEAVGDRSTLAYSLNNIAIIREKLGDYRSALEFHERSLQLKREGGDRIAESGSLTNLGTIYSHLRDHARAVQCHRQSLEIARAAGNRHGEALSLINIGCAYEEQQDYDTAGEYFAQGLMIMREVGDRYFEAEALLSIGENVLHKRLPGRASVDFSLIYLEPALELAVALESKELIYRAHQALAEVHERSGDFERALKHHKAFFRAREAVFGEESDQKIKSVLVQSEVDKVQREAEIHRLRHVELARAYQDLQEVDRQKEELLNRLKEQARELHRQTHEDALTGISNRRHLDAQLTREFARSRRFGHDLTVALLDIDDFKQINDRLSHQIGDEVLRTVARLLREGCRCIDLVGRWGGEEFLLVLVETNLESAQILCERLLKDIASHDWQAIHPDLKVTFSAGVCATHGLASAEALISASDAALYAAKRGGKNRICAHPLP
jgi:diguanylate cyclase (GGDEF)-like protein